MSFPNRALLWILTPLVVGMLILETQIARSRIRAGRIIRQVEAQTMVAVQSDRVTRNLTAANLRLLREADALISHDVSIPIARGSQYLLMKRPEEALASYSEALELEARPEIFLNMGRAHRLSGQEDEAIEAFVLAVKLSPRLRLEVPKDVRKKVAIRARR